MQQRGGPSGRPGGRLGLRLGDRLLLLVALGLVIALLLVEKLPVPPARAVAPPPAPTQLDPVEAQVERAGARLAAVMRPYAPQERPPQFVLFSFDGAGSHRHWERVLAVAGESQARVTGFLSGVYLLTDEERRQYRPPGRAAGGSAIGFGGTSEDVDVLVGDLMTARGRGHEIGTHYNGHFCAGSAGAVGSWTTAMWDAELEQFAAFVDAARGRGLDLGPDGVQGGRTPCLEGRWSQAYPAMRAHGLRYEASRPTDGIVWPTDEGGIRQFWMPSVRVPALDERVLLMDYNLWLALNGGRDEPERAGEFSDAVLGAYRAAHAAAADGNRAPLVVGNHFNRWSGGGFFDAVLRFMAEACVSPETVCATHADVSAWLDLQDPEVLAQWRSLPRAQVPASAP